VVFKITTFFGIGGLYPEYRDSFILRQFNTHLPTYTV